MKKIALIIISIFVVALFFGCDVEKKSTDAIQAQQTELALGEAQRQIGMPNITNFQQRKMMKWIYELADDEKLITYTYIKADMTGKLIFVGKSLGYGVPFSAQFTNPERAVQLDRQSGINASGYHFGKLPQADPNGLFMPTSSSATWVIMIDPEDGKPRPQYWEPELVISPFPLSKYLGSEVVVGDESKWGKKEEKAADKTQG